MYSLLLCMLPHSQVPTQHLSLSMYVDRLISFLRIHMYVYTFHTIFSLFAEGLCGNARANLFQTHAFFKTCAFFLCFFGEKSAVLTKKAWVKNQKYGNGAFLGPKKRRKGQKTQRNCVFFGEPTLFWEKKTRKGGSGIAEKACT